MVKAEGEQQRPFSLPYPLADLAILSGNLAKARLREKDRMRGNMPCFSAHYPSPRPQAVRPLPHGRGGLRRNFRGSWIFSHARRRESKVTQGRTGCRMDA